MSLKLLGTSFGQDREVALVPNAHVAVGYLCVAVGLFFGWSATTDRAAQKNIVELCIGMAIFLLGLGIFAVTRIGKDTKTPVVATIGWSHLTFTQGNAHRGEVALRDITRILAVSGRYATTYVYESTGGADSCICTRRFLTAFGGSGRTSTCSPPASSSSWKRRRARSP